MSDVTDERLAVLVERAKAPPNYEPSNCRWATAKEQRHNSRRMTISFDARNEILGRMEHGEKAASVAGRLGVSVSIVGQIKRGS